MLLAFLLFASLVNDVRDLIRRHDLGAADRTARTYQAQAGPTPQLAAAFSWLARGAWDGRQIDLADSYASETRKMVLDLLKTRRLDGDPWLSTALGASIEVHSQVLAARGERAEAIAFLRRELALYGSTSIGERLRKDLNLLNLAGKPAPPLDEKDWLGPPPVTLASLRGHPVLLFFWAHWCPDCKAQAGMLSSVMQAWGSKGLVLIAPTRLYGYVAGGLEAPPPVEKQYIDRVQRQYYPMLNGVSIPLSADNFLEYGASTTPTVVLLDAAGTVRFYHPGAVTEQEISEQLRKTLAK